MINKQVVLNLPEIDNFHYNEAIKTLRTNIQLAGASVKKIQVTSVGPNEGKSTISIRLANSFAESGKKTLYIDADIRKSVVATRFLEGGEIYGLTEILAGQVEMDAAIYKTNIPKLDIVFAGPYSPFPTELFEDIRCKQFFEHVNQLGYDMVIMDTAPLGLVIDAVILSRYVDGTAVVAESEVATKQGLKRVLDQLDRASARVLGVILNKIKTGKGGYYYKDYGYKYGYGYDYGYEYKK